MDRKGVGQDEKISRNPFAGDHFSALLHNHRFRFNS